MVIAFISSPLLSCDDLELVAFGLRRYRFSSLLQSCCEAVLWCASRSGGDAADPFGLISCLTARDETQ